jgi:hypothetical protein
MSLNIRFEHEKTISSLLTSNKIKDYSYTLNHDFDKIFFVGSVMNRSIVSEIVKSAYNYYVQQLHAGFKDFSDYKDKIDELILEHTNLISFSLKYKIGKDYQNYKKSVARSYKASSVLNSEKIGIISDPSPGDSFFILEFNYPIFEDKGSNELAFAFVLEDLVNNTFNIKIKDLNLDRLKKDVNKELKKLFKRFSWVVTESDVVTQHKLDQWFK